VELRQFIAKALIARGIPAKRVGAVGRAAGGMFDEAVERFDDPCRAEGPGVPSVSRSRSRSHRRRPVGNFSGEIESS
jgi:hypothetical protein